MAIDFDDIGVSCKRCFQLFFGRAHFLRQFGSVFEVGMSVSQMSTDRVNAGADKETSDRNSTGLTINDTVFELLQPG